MLDITKAEEYAHSISAGLLAAVRKIDAEPKRVGRDNEPPSVVMAKIAITDIKGNVFRLKVTGVWPRLVCEVFMNGNPVGEYAALGEMPEN